MTSKNTIFIYSYCSAVRQKKKRLMGDWCRVMGFGTLPHMENDASQNQEAKPYMSRRERRELMRARSGGGFAGRPSTGAIRRVLIWGGCVAVIVLIGWGMVKLSKNVAVPTGDGTLSVSVSEQDNIRGPADAKVTLVEYSDFQCPACAAFFSVITKALAEPELKDRIRFVYRYFPLPTHPNAQLASQAAQAAALQGKFWEMHDLLFDKQDTWSPLSTTAVRGAFTEYAQQLGLDKNKFLSDIDSNAVKDRVRADLNGGTAAGVNSTPSFFVGSARMPHPQSYDEFKQNLINAVNANQ